MSKHKKLFTSILACVLVAALVAGSTVAFLTDSERKANTLTIGDVDIILEEPHWEDAQDGAELLAGDTYVKDPTVTQIAGSSYFRMVVTFMDMETGEQITDPERLALIRQIIRYDSTYASATYAPGTAFLEGTPYTLAELEAAPMVNPVFAEDTVNSVPGKYYYNYQSVLQEGASVTLFTNIVVPVEWTQDQLRMMGDIKIEVLAEAIQEKHFATPAEALAALAGEIDADRLKEEYGEVGRGVGEGKAVIPVTAQYYSDFSTAMLDATDNTTDHADLPNKVGAVACVVPDDVAGATVYLMDDITLDSTVEISNQAITLNFNGFFITEAASARIVSKAESITLTNNGSNVSGGIIKDHSGSTSASYMVLAYKDMTILSGYYKSYGDSSKNALGIVGSGTTVVEDCTIDVRNETYNAYALQNQGTMTVNNATLFAHSEKRQVHAIVNYSNMTINDVTVHASNGVWYTLGSSLINKSSGQTYVADLLINGGTFYQEKSGTKDTGSPAGSAINNALGKITIMDCTAVGMNAGIYTGKNEGTGGIATENVVYIYGGDFSSVNHGGASFSGEKNYVFGGTFRNTNTDDEIAMGGFYIGSTYNDVLVYMDGATVTGGVYGGVCSSNYSYCDTTLYVSNTEFSGSEFDLRVDGINGDGYQGHLYVGKNVSYDTITGDGMIDTETYQDVEFTSEYVEGIA